MNLENTPVTFGSLFYIYIQPIRFELVLIGPIESLWWGIRERVLEDTVITVNNFSASTDVQSHNLLKLTNQI